MKYDVSPYARWNPKPSWMAVHFFPPQRGHVYTVKRGEDGTPFTAKLTYGGSWIDDAGQIIGTANLYYLQM
jgi:hypothetical protein